MSRSRKRRRRSCEPRRRRPRGGPPGRIGHAEGEAGWANGGRPQAAIAHTLGAAGRRRRQRAVEGRRHLSWTALVFEGEGHGAEAANSRRARCNTPCGEGDKSTSPPRKAGSADHAAQHQQRGGSTATTTRCRKATRARWARWAARPEGRRQRNSRRCSLGPHRAGPRRTAPAQRTTARPHNQNNQTSLPYHFFLYHTTSQTNQKSGNYHKNTGKTTSLITRHVKASQESIGMV